MEFCNFARFAAVGFATKDPAEFLSEAASCRRGCARSPLRLRVVGAPEDETVVVPAFALKMLVEILDEMGRGNTVSVIPVHAELTTQEAADLLSISRPSLNQMLDEGKVEYR